MQPAPVPDDARELTAAARTLRLALQARLGRPLGPGEWRALNFAGRNSASELTPVEAELLLRLAQLGGRWPLAWRAQRELAGGLTGRLTGWLLWSAVVGGLVVLNARMQPASVPLLWFPAAASCSLAGLLIAARERLAVLQLVQRELPGSDLLERVVANDPQLGDIVEHTPVAFRWLLGPPGSSLADRVAVIARNLDWYLHPPAAWFRWHWLAAVARGMLCVVLGAGALNLWLNLGWLPQPACLALTLYAVIDPPRRFDFSLRSYCAQALAELLRTRVRERFAAEQSSAPVALPPEAVD